ncbi:MAG: TolC family protein [Pseudomonadota bacterium]
MFIFLLPFGVAAFALAMPATAQLAEPASPLTLPAALALATQANPSLSAARHEVQAQQGALLQAAAHPNPSLSYEVTDPGRAARETVYLFTQPLEPGARRGARIAVAGHGRDIASAELATQQAELHADVLTAFHEVLIAQERLRLAQDGAELAGRGTLAASRRVAAGKVSPLDATRAQLAQAGAQLDAAQAANALTSARKRLSALWANPAPRFESAQGEFEMLPPLPSAAALENWRDMAPALARARAELERRRAMSQLELARRTPDVGISVGLKRSQEAGRSQAIVGLSVPLPLFDRNRGNVQEALSRTDKAVDELAAADIGLENELAQAVQDLAAARHSVDVLRQDILPGARHAADAAAKGFEFGKQSFLDVLDAQRTLLQVRSQYLAALSAGHRAAAAIERILGHIAPSTEHREQP